jgi:hypothetical protein
MDASRYGVVKPAPTPARTERPQHRADHGGQGINMGQALRQAGVPLTLAELKTWQAKDNAARATGETKRRPAEPWTLAELQVWQRRQGGQGV